LKAAVDFAVGMKHGTIKRMIIKIGGKEIPLSASPYAAFEQAVNELSGMKSFIRLPVLSEEPVMMTRTIWLLNY
jgi:hypothetical protein